VKVKMVVAVSGTRGGEDWPPIGGVLEVSDEEGAQLCGGQLAVPVKETDADKAEKAVAPEAETREGPLTTESGPTKRGPGRPRKSE
jgi:hypothetical protein